MKQMWFKQCPDEFKPICYIKYADKVFTVFESQDHYTKFRDY